MSSVILKFIECVSIGNTVLIFKISCLHLLFDVLAFSYGIIIIIMVIF